MTKTNIARLVFSALVYSTLAYGIYAAPNSQLKFVLCIFAICAGVINHRVLQNTVEGEGNSIKLEVLILGNGPAERKEKDDYLAKNCVDVAIDAAMTLPLLGYAVYELYLLART